MRKILACAACLFLLLAASGKIACALTFDEFKTKADEFFDDKITPDTMLKLTDEALAKDAKSDAAYAAYAHAIKANIYWSKNDNKKALPEARKAVELNPKTEAGYIVLGEILRDSGKHEEGAEAIEQAAANSDDAERKKGLQQFANDMRLEGSAVTPPALWKAFDENEVAAEDAYKGKVMAVKGKIESITASATGYPQVNFTVDRIGVHKVTCEFDKEARAQIGKLKKGQQVLIAGTCQGMIIKSVFLRKCRIME